jgi:lipoprotein-anchoring transpeptidase ErfK/SrfK
MRCLRHVCALGAAVALLAGCAESQSSSSTPRTTTVPIHTASAAAAAPPVAAVSPAASSAAVRPRPASAVRPRPASVNHCKHNTAAQLVKVSIHAQHAWMCARTQTVFSTAITTGMVGQYTSTPTGDYHVQGRSRDTVLTLNTGAQYTVKYWIPFDAPLFGFHDSSWQRFPYGSAKYRTQGSHGCVHMPLKAMKFLYGWADVGASVHIA